MLQVERVVGQGPQAAECASQPLPFQERSSSWLRKVPITLARQGERQVGLLSSKCMPGA